MLYVPAFFLIPYLHQPVSDFDVTLKPTRHWPSFFKWKINVLILIRVIFHVRASSSQFLLLLILINPFFPSQAICPYYYVHTRITCVVNCVCSCIIGAVFISYVRKWSTYRYVRTGVRQLLVNSS